MTIVGPIIKYSIMNYRQFYFVLYALVLSACNFNNNNKVRERSTGNEVVGLSVTDSESLNTSSLDTISFLEFKKEYLADNVFSSTRIVPLETREESLIGNIRQLVAQNGNIYVWDDTQGAHSILTFDLNGNYISAIRATGKGPGEYINIRAFNVDENGDIYIVNSSTDKHIIKYSPQGEYLKTIELEVPTYAFAIFNNKIYGYNGSTTYFDQPSGDGFYILDMDGSYLKGLLKYKKPLNITPSRPIFVLENKVYINPPYSSTLYSLTENDHLKSEFYLDSKQGKANLFEKDKFKNIYLFGNTLFSLISIKNDEFYGFEYHVADLKSKRGLKIWDSRFKPNYKKGILSKNLMSPGDVMDGSVLITAVNSDSFSSINLQYEDFREQAPDTLVNFAKELDEKANPILLFNTINEHIIFNENE